MRKGIKLLAAITAAATVSAMSMSVFAAPTVTTTTTYSGTDVTVTTNVTGAAANEEVAYMVKDTAATTLDNTTIYYIDQKTANASGNIAEPFSFTMAKSKIVGTASATVMVGTTSSAASASAYTVDGVTTDDINLANCTVTYTVCTGGKVFVLGTSDVALGDVAATGTAAGVAKDTITFAVVPDAGYELATVNGAAVTLTNGKYVYTVPNSATATVDFAFAAKTGDAGVTDATGVDIDVAAKTVTATAKASGAFTEAGIRIGDMEFPALAFGSDGSYTVTVVETVEDGAEALITDGVAVVSYVK